MATRSLEEQRKAFAAEFGSFAPDSLSDDERQFADERAEQLQNDHPPPYEAVVVDRRNGEVKAVERELMTSVRAAVYASKLPAVAPSLSVARTAPQRPRERRDRRTSRTVGSRGDPSEPSDEPPEHLERLRPLTAVARAYLRAEVDRRRREIVAAQPEVSPEVFHLFDGDRRS